MNKEEVIDLTVSTVNKIHGWCALLERFLPDHRHISFMIEKLELESVSFMNPRRMYWASYKNHLEDRIRSFFGKI